MEKSEEIGHSKDWRRARKEEAPASTWLEKENLDGRVVDVGVVILRTSGCRHFREGGCSMCGYNIESSPNVSPTDIERQFELGMDRLGHVEFLKIYTSGSFLDKHEVPIECADKVLKSCADKGVRLLFESRPEFITPERIENALRIHDKLEVALGLESSNDSVLRYSVNKGMTAKDYEEAASILKDKGVALRTYVLLKPPFLTEAEAVADAIRTIDFASAWSTTISLNPVNVQKGTLVEKLWRTWSYRPPWLWSVLEVLRSSAKGKTRIICSPAGAGKERGAHNCGKCDEAILDSLRSFSLSQDISKLAAPDCACEELWRAIIETEGFVMGGTPDLQRFFRMHRA